MSKIPKICFKSDLVFNRFCFCKYILKEICFDMYQWSLLHNCIFFITETKTTLDEDNKLNRISSTHRDGRAFDLSCKGWNDNLIKAFIKHFSTKYVGYGAIKDNTERLIVHHDNGNGIHFHIQIRSGLSLENNSKV